MKTKLSVAGVIALVLVLSVTSMGLAQGDTRTSTFQVQNLSSSSDAHVNITYYKQDGTLDAGDGTHGNPAADTIAASASKTYNPVWASTGFNGSVVVASDAEVAVIANLVLSPRGDTNANALGSYVGFKQGASKLYFPLIMKGNNGNDTDFNIQNAGTGSVDVDLVFTPQTTTPAGGTAFTVQDTIPVGAAHSYNQATMSQLSGYTKWIGSVVAKVRTTTPSGLIAGVANQVNSNTAAYANKNLLTYNAFTDGSTEVYAPLVMQANSNNRTSINCQNIDETLATNLTLELEAGATGVDTTPKTNVQPGAAAGWVQTYDGTKYVGSAKVKSSNTAKIVCVINQTNQVKKTASAYEGFDPTKATNTIVAPLIMSRNGNDSKGYAYTSINVATADGSTATFVVNYTANGVTAAGCPTTPPSSYTSSSAKSSDQINQSAGVYSGAQATCQYVGGVTITTVEGKLIVAIINQSRSTGTTSAIKDVLTTYDGFNQ